MKLEARILIAKTAIVMSTLLFLLMYAGCSCVAEKNGVTNVQKSQELVFAEFLPLFEAKVAVDLKSVEEKIAADASLSDAQKAERVAVARKEAVARIDDRRKLIESTRALTDALKRSLED